MDEYLQSYEKMLQEGPLSHAPFVHHAPSPTVHWTLGFWL